MAAWLAGGSTIGAFTEPLATRRRSIHWRDARTWVIGIRRLRLDQRPSQKLLSGSVIFF